MSKTKLFIKKYKSLEVAQKKANTVGGTLEHIPTNVKPYKVKWVEELKPRTKKFTSLKSAKNFCTKVCGEIIDYSHDESKIHNYEVVFYGTKDKKRFEVDPKDWNISNDTTDKYVETGDFHTFGYPDDYWKD